MTCLIISVDMVPFPVLPGLIIELQQNLKYNSLWAASQLQNLIYAICVGGRFIYHLCGVKEESSRYKQIRCYIKQCCGSGFGSGRIRSFLVTRIRILYPQKDPMLFKFLVIKLSKIQFRPKNFFIFDFKCHMMFRFGGKMP